MFLCECEFGECCDCYCLYVDVWIDMYCSCAALLRRWEDEVCEVVVVLGDCLGGWWLVEMSVFFVFLQEELLVVMDCWEVCNKVVVVCIV